MKNGTLFFKRPNNLIAQWANNQKQKPALTLTDIEYIGISIWFVEAATVQHPKVWCILSTKHNPDYL